MATEVFATQIKGYMEKELNKLRDQHEIQCEWFVGEIQMLTQQVDELELELMMANDGAYDMPGKQNGVRLNIKKRRIFNNEE